MTLDEFITKYEPCEDAVTWLKTCTDLRQAIETAKPEWIIWAVRLSGVLSDRDQRLFACWCVRQIWNAMTDDRSKNAVEVAERFARKKATRDELSAAESAAWSAAESAQADYLRPLFMAALDRQVTQ
jgi:hypothetical protein